MTDRQANKLRSFNATLDLCEENIKRVSNVPAFVNFYYRLEKFCHEIDKVVGEQNEYNKEITAAKKKAKLDLAEGLYLISSNVRAYANNNGNMELSGYFSFSLSSVKYAKDGELLPKCDFLLNLLNPIMDKLEDFMINPSTIEHIHGLRNDYKRKQSKPRLTIGQHKLFTEKVNDLIKSCTNFMVKEMDSMAEFFKNSDPDFYKLYKSSREVLDLGRTYTKFRGYVTDGSNKDKAIEGALIRIAHTEVETKSSNSGRFSLRLSPGTHTIEISKPGYGTMVKDEVYFKPGEETIYRIVLDKAGKGMGMLNEIKLNPEALERAMEMKMMSVEEPVV
jgi:hypothetical protein